MRRVPCLALLLLITFSAGVRAQEKPPANVITPTSGPRLEFLDEISFYEQRYMRLADAIPPEKYSWRPGPEMRTIGELYMHVVVANYTNAKTLGTPLPTTFDPKALAAEAGDKTKVLQALKDSFVHFRNAVLVVKDTELDKEIKTPRGQTTIRGSLFQIDGNIGELLGQSIVYARATGIVPPWVAERQPQESERPKP
jgi:hypothetical protein